MMGGLILRARRSLGDSNDQVHCDLNDLRRSHHSSRPCTGAGQPASGGGESYRCGCVQGTLTQDASPQAAQFVLEAIEAAGCKPLASDSVPVNPPVSRAGGCCCAANRKQKIDVHQRAMAKLRGSCNSNSTRTPSCVHECLLQPHWPQLCFPEWVARRHPRPRRIIRPIIRPTELRPRAPLHLARRRVLKPSTSK